MTDISEKAVIASDRLPAAEEVLALFRRLNWAKMELRDPARFDAALECSWPVVTAWSDGRLVGICRCITDGEYTAYICDLAVDPEFQGNGLGSTLVTTALEMLEGYDTIALMTSVARVEFWEKFGFSNIPGGMILYR